MLTLRLFLMDCVVLLAVTLAAYFGVLWNGFVDFDDNVYVTYNSHTSKGLSFDGFYYAWTTFDSGNWIPLTWLSYQLDASLFGMGPIGFHVTNVVLHAANVVLLFAWLVRVTGSRWRSMVVATLFALHPLHVESVAWVAERKDVLSTFWLLMTLHAYAQYALRPKPGWYLITCVAFLWGLLSKSMLVTLPLLLLIVDVWPLRRWANWTPLDATAGNYPAQTFRWLLIEKAPLLMLSLIIGIVTIAAASSSKVIADLPLRIRLGNALQSYGWYFAKTFVPTQLSALYPYPIDSLDWTQVGVAAVVLTLVSIYVGVFGFRRPHLLFGWLWFLFALTPVIGVLHVGSQSHADRYSYIPHIGLLLMLVWEGHFLSSYFRLHRSVLVVAVSVFTVGFAWLTTCQISVWRTTETLWKHALSVDPDNWYAHGALGTLCLDSDNLNEAAKHFQHVARQRPEEKESLARLLDIYRRYGARGRNSSQFYNDLGLYRVHEKDMQSATLLFEKAVTIEPANLSARNNLALALSQLGRNREAQLHLETVLALKPDDVNAHVNLGVLLQNSNRLETARQHFSAALHLKPDDQEARERLGEVENRLKSRSK